MNRKTAVIDATGYRTETRYTLRGDVVSITNANNETVKFETDALGRKTAAVDPMGFRSEYQYDQNGNLTCTIDANAQAGLQPKNTLGCTESRTYDELNRVTKIVDAQNNETVFTYDLAGNRLTVKDAELKTHSFAYDDLERLVSETDHAGKVTSYKPDEAGNVYETINRLAETTRVTYDKANRATRVDYLKDASFETFGYDPAGTQANAVSGNIGYTFTWDRLNRLTGKLDSRGKSLAFTYDKVGNTLTKTTYQGSTTRYLYNAANRLTQLINPDYLQVDYQYDPAGRLLSRVTSAGARTTSQFDANGWQTKLTQYDAANALISDVSYTRDRTGNILTQTDVAGTTTYAYDPLYRLKTADLPGTANDELFTYDKVGNRKTATKGSLIANTNTRYYNYVAGTNRLLDIRIGSAVGTVESSFTNDFEGRLTAQTGLGAKTFTWDAKSRVKTLTKSGVTEIYAYDPMDHRIGRSGGALGSLDYYLEGEHLESIYSGANLQAKYLRGSSIDELVAGYLYDTDLKLKPFLFHHDNVTSTTAMSGHNGGTLQSTIFSAFGQTQSTTGTSPNRLKYTGREEDGTGLYYYRARYYSPTEGRFISEDPLGFAAGDVNFYAYVGNNPLNANDPNGMNPVSIVKLAEKLTAKGIEGAEKLIARRGWRVSEREAVEQAAARGPNGGIVCPGCGKEVLTYDINHVKKWGETQREFLDTLGKGGTVTRSEVRDAYGKNIEAMCPGCNRADNKLPAIAAGTVGAGVSGNAQAGDSGIFGSGFTWRGIFEGALDFLVSPGTANAPGLSSQGGATGSWGSSGVSGSWGGAANGGFLLYPNKSNTNMMRSVYSK